MGSGVGRGDAFKSPQQGFMDRSTLGLKARREGNYEGENLQRMGWATQEITDKYIALGTFDNFYPQPSYLATL